MVFYNFLLFFVYKYKFDLYNIVRGVDMNRIKQLRDEIKMSQTELGKKLNKTQQQISLYENGTNELDLDGYMILSQLFNCSIEYIAGKSDIRNPKQEDPLGLAKIGFSMDKYVPPTDAQREQIKGLLEVILKDNKKDKSDK